MRQLPFAGRGAERLPAPLKHVELSVDAERLLLFEQPLSPLNTMFKAILEIPIFATVLDMSRNSCTNIVDCDC